jgi:hypothetical protein
MVKIPFDFYAFFFHNRFASTSIITLGLVKASNLNKDMHQVIQTTLTQIR